MTTSESSSRNSSVDIARGLGIILVVFGHNWIVYHQPGELYRVIFSFHMPLFFFLSGVFLTPDRDLGTTLTQKADSLLKPYIAVLLMLAAWYMIPQRVFSPGYFAGMLYGTGQSILWIQLWFLPNLFLTQVLAIVLLKGVPRLSRNTPWLAAFIVALLLTGIQALHFGHDLRLLTLELLPGQTRKTIGLPWSLDIVLVNMAFLLAGFLSARQTRAPGRQALPMAMLSGATLAMLHLLYDDTLNMNGRLYDATLVSSIQAFAGIYLVVGLSGMISSNPRSAKLLAYFGKASLFIFIFHGVFQGTATNRLQTWLPEAPYTAAWLGLFAGMGFPLVLYEICRHTPLLATVLLPRHIKPRQA